MKFGIITHAIHKVKNNEVYAYEPYVREMNLWAKHVDEIIVLCPVSIDQVNNIEIAYKHNKIKVVEIPNFDITSIKNLFKALLIMPNICWQIYKVMKQVDHIHLRCPGNIGLLGAIVQILFSSKKKTAKYAGNWDPESKQPITYKLQKWILSNVFLTKNIQVLVYGSWPNQTKNILPFFTASYHKHEIEEISEKRINEKINLIFVGGLTIGKQPLLSVKVTHELIKKGYNVCLNIYGDGIMRNDVEDFINQHQLKEHIVLHGNVNKDEVKLAFKNSHFLIFISKSEGWPKVVAEAMFWSCLPITSKISCISYMLGNNTRGKVTDSSLDKITEEVESYLLDQDLYLQHVKNAEEWSRIYTLEKFENEIVKLLT